MTKLLDEAIANIRTFPVDRQNEAASVLLTMANQTAPALTEEQIAGVKEAIAEADDGKLVNRAGIDKMFEKHLS